MPIHLHQFFNLLIKKGVGTWPEDALATSSNKHRLISCIVEMKGATSIVLLTAE